MNHMKLQRVGHTVQGVLRPHLVVRGSPVEMHLNKFIANIERTSLQQGSVRPGQQLHCGPCVGGCQGPRADGEILMANQREGTIVLVLGRGLLDVNGGLSSLEFLHRLHPFGLSITHGTWNSSNLELWSFSVGHLGWTG